MPIQMLCWANDLDFVCFSPHWENNILVSCNAIRLISKQYLYTVRYHNCRLEVCGHKRVPRRTEHGRRSRLSSRCKPCSLQDPGTTDRRRAVCRKILKRVIVPFQRSSFGFLSLSTSFLLGFCLFLVWNLFG